MPSADDHTLDDYLDEWLDRRRTQLRPTTLRGYRQTVDCYVRPHLGARRLSRLDRRLLERVYARLLAAGGVGGRPLSPRTVQLTHAVLHRALRDAQLDGLLEHNPAELARTPKRDPNAVEAEQRIQVWTAREAAQFLELVDDYRWRTPWHVALGDGARRGELLGLGWQDVDLDRAQLTIRRALTVVDGVARLLGTKTSRARTLSLGPSVVDALRQHRAAQARAVSASGADDAWSLVFTDDAGGHVEPMAVTHEFRRLVRKLPFPVIRLHDLRHTHASLLLEQGVTAKVVSDRLGHTTISMTMDIYAHLMPAMDQDAAARLDEALHGDSCDTLSGDSPDGADS